MIDFFLAKHHISRTNGCRKKSKVKGRNFQFSMISELGVSALVFFRMSILNVGSKLHIVLLSEYLDEPVIP